MNRTPIDRYIDNDTNHLSFSQINLIREVELGERMRSLNIEIRALESYISSRQETGLPELYTKLYHYLVKHLAQAEAKLKDLSSFDSKAQNLVLDEVEEIIDRLDSRIAIVSNFLINSSPSSAAS